ncbi:hypothetical protein BU14_0361s0018 [Porphyra umbilicalis]|uniref:Uncharacterized protein n=1 Tax=Porphyra umbilicalis TaxID=2786 RepID=A0A1X6NXE7_PORUM|nr:hypothetical protein BU14_0361s0018 [Porphyra umbilicalis]|eukprot:OSX73291.1 hypothetical protein BU14_0361s0018 [Porphyra umbilicalis]
MAAPTHQKKSSSKRQGCAPPPPPTHPSQAAAHPRAVRRKAPRLVHGRRARRDALQPTLVLAVGARPRAHKPKHPHVAAARRPARRLARHARRHHAHGEHRPVDVGAPLGARRTRVARRRRHGRRHPLAHEGGGRADGQRAPVRMLEPTLAKAGARGRPPRVRVAAGEGAANGRARAARVDAGAVVEQRTARVAGNGGRAGWGGEGGGGRPGSQRRGDGEEGGDGGGAEGRHRGRRVWGCWRLLGGEGGVGYVPAPATRWGEGEGVALATVQRTMGRWWWGLAPWRVPALWLLCRYV